MNQVKQLKYIHMYQAQALMKFLIHLMKWTYKLNNNNKEISGKFRMYYC